MLEKIFIVTRRTTSRAVFLFWALLLLPCLLSAGPAMAADELFPPLTTKPAAEPDATPVDTEEDEKAGAEKKTQSKIFKTGIPFFDESSIEGGLYYITHRNDRYDIERDTFEQNYNHGTMQAGLEFNSGYLGNFLGFEVGAYGSYNLYDHATPDTDMNFMPWRTPWNPDLAPDGTSDGASFYKAHIKGKIKNLWFKAGYFQPSGPGVLGADWTFFPGAYLGGEIGFDYNGLSIAGAWVTEYKAPWYKHSYSFKKADGVTDVDYMRSLGVRYSFDSGLSLEVAYGDSEDFFQNAHFKAEYQRKFYEGDLKLGYHAYLLVDGDGDPWSENNLFGGPAWQQFVFAGYERGNWSSRLEFTWSMAPQENELQPGFFAYKMATSDGGAQGAYEVWWDMRSDWNHDNEKALFAGLWYSFGEFDLPGLKAGVSGAYGWGGRAMGVEEKLKESAWSADLSYTVQDGYLQGAFAMLRYTRYYNHTQLPSYEGFKNAAQNENDFKLLVGIPFSL